MNSQEVWKAVPGFEQLYSVSNFGRVKSHDHIVVLENGGTYTKKGRLLKPNIDKDGYRIVTLYNGKSKKCSSFIVSLL